MANEVSLIEESDDSFHLRGNYAPVPDEVTAFDLPVEGALPAELDGLFLRNGPNPRSGSSSHWFAGDGMLHGVRLEAGRALWYRNRYVRTPSFVDSERNVIGEDGSLDLAAGGPANTHVIGHELHFFGYGFAPPLARIRLPQRAPFGFHGSWIPAGDLAT